MGVLEKMVTFGLKMFINSLTVFNVTLFVCQTTNMESVSEKYIKMANLVCFGGYACSFYIIFL